LINFNEQNLKTMKKYLLSTVAIATLTMSALAQPACKVLFPASIAGNKTFTWADPTSWGQTPDFNIPGVFVEDTLAFVEDGTPGLNAQGNPKSQEGCNPLINGVDVAGKIAVCYRGTCEFGAKAMNAQNAGAVAVIIINRDPEAVGMGAGAQGANVTIPVVMITSVDGANIKAEMQNGPVVMFLGNKQGLNPNDLSTNTGVARIKNFAGSNSRIENGFTPAIEIYNVGNQAQSAVSVRCLISGPGGIPVYDQTAGPISMAAGDTVYIQTGNPYSFPAFSLPIYPNGDYTMSYTISLGANTDDDMSDNMLSYGFKMNDEYVSLSRLDANNDPIATSFPSNSTASYKACMSFRDANASNSKIGGYKFVPEADTAAVDMAGEEILFKVFTWSDSSVLDYNELTEVFNEAIYLTDDNDTRQVKTVDLDQSFFLDDNQLYLICLETANGVDIAFGFDNTIDYSGNTAITGISTSPIEVFPSGAAGLTWYGGGWSGTTALSLALNVVALNAGIDEVVAASVNVFPNPTQNEVSLNSSVKGAATVVVSDLAGKAVASKAVNFGNGSVQMTTEGLEAGMYVFNIQFENGQQARVNVVKN